MTSFDNRYPPPYSYNTMPVRGRRGNEQQYAESLQDFPTRPRSGSGDSLRSDSFLLRPQRNYTQSTNQGSYVNSGFLSPQNNKKQVHVEERVTTEKARYEMKPQRNDMNWSGNETNITLDNPPKLKQRKPSEKDKKG